MANNEINVYTDGGCSGNPGRGAWAYVALQPVEERIIHQGSGRVAMTTNNRMELCAVIEALRWVQAQDSHQPVALFTDSQYVKRGINEWIHTWQSKNWKTSAKKPVKNRDLWEQVLQLQKHLTIEWHWVAGHAGHYYNELCHNAIAQLLKQR